MRVSIRITAAILLLASANGAAHAQERITDVIRLSYFPPTAVAQIVRSIEGPPRFQYHDVPHGSAEAAAKWLKRQFEDPEVRVDVAGPGRLFVWGNRRVHAAIRSEINNFSKK